MSELSRRFQYHPADTQEKRIAHGEVRDSCFCLATVLNGSLPEGREKSLALTKLEEAMFWSNAAIARNSGS